MSQTSCSCKERKSSSPLLLCLITFSSWQKCIVYVHLMHYSLASSTILHKQQVKHDQFLNLCVIGHMFTTTHWEIAKLKNCSCDIFRAKYEYLLTSCHAIIIKLCKSHTWKMKKVDILLIITKVANVLDKHQKMRTLSTKLLTHWSTFQHLRCGAQKWLLLPLLFETWPSVKNLIILEG